ncbi:hypothetical protein [Streptomyces tendae]|uniref:hypothetical protein n=1 Tax=Streptomyces tendae TaxID=1932 RepID=UPI001F3C0C26|nr:hypothetical protein [Streptomyces tendae]
MRLTAAPPIRRRSADWRVPSGFREGKPGDVPPGDAEGGRGLHLVRACADAVGVSVLRELGASRGGRLLWAECRRDDLP